MNHLQQPNAPIFPKRLRRKNGRHIRQAKRNGWVSNGSKSEMNWLDNGPPCPTAWHDRDQLTRMHVFGKYKRS